MNTHIDTVLGQLEAVSFYGRRPGPRLLVLGAVHGIEVCGPIAISSIIRGIRSSELKIASGVVTLIAVANPDAFTEGRRYSIRDMNRDFREHLNPQISADHYNNLLSSVMKQHDVLLDLHSFRAEGRPFVFVGPENNSGSIQPFQMGIEEQNFAESLGVSTLVDGWFNTYTNFAEEQARLIAEGKVSVAAADVAIGAFGRGTTEYFRTLGPKYGVTIECGRHDEPETVEVARGAILNALRFLGITDTHTELKCDNNRESYRFSKIFIRYSSQDQIRISNKSFTEVRKAQVIGERSDGEAVTAPSDGVIIFTYQDARPGKEWMYFAERTDRFGRR